MARGALEPGRVHRGEAEAGEVAPPVGALGCQLDRAAERLERGLVAAQHGEQLADQRVARGDLRGGIARAPRRHQRGLVIAGGGQRARQALQRQRQIGCQRQRLAMAADRLLEPAQRAQALGEVGEQAGVARLQLERAPAVAQGGGEVAEAGERRAQQVVRIGVVGIGLEQPPAACRGELRAAGAQLLLRLEQPADAARRDRSLRGEACARRHGGLRRRRAADRDATGSPRRGTRADGPPAARCRSAAAPSD